jgi:tetratricopeptide (TPR) repeat protein
VPGERAAPPAHGSRRGATPRAASFLAAPARRLTAGGLVFAILAIVLAAGCASSDADAPARRAAPRHDHLLPPTDGWSGDLDEGQRSALASGFAALGRDGDSVAALGAADDLLARTPDLRPALVLAAQAELVAGDHASARAHLESWIAQEPAYRAARLLWARVLELDGDVALAHVEYRALADQLPVAEQRARATREEAVGDAAEALRAALDAGQVEEARDWAALLAEWEPADSAVVLGARLDVARAAGDEPGELDVLRALDASGRTDRPTLERLAALELEIGDADQALRLLEGLVEEEPDDRELQSQLAAAQLRFRLRLLPEDVQQLASRGELRRGEFAALLYWVVPGVRQAQAGGSARIASDVLDHDRQQEIMRVVNRGLMRVNPVLHRFEPDRPITRAEAIASAIEVAAARPGGECVADARGASAANVSFLCGVAARCGLLEDQYECLPQARLSGGEALALLGRALSIQRAE